MDSLKALAFDVFGTVVDTRGSILHEMVQFGNTRGLRTDWTQFTDAWIHGYSEAVADVRQGKLPWMSVDALNRRNLDRLLVEYKVEGLSEGEKQEINEVWHRLKPWPDALSGLQRLRKRFTLLTLANGNVTLLTDLAKNAGLPWDYILSAELARHYKPDQEVYQFAISHLGLPAEQIMMVAAHPFDLRAARQCGLKTAFVSRPLEWGLGVPSEPPDPLFDLHTHDFNDLASQLGA